MTKILVIEDEETIRENILELLEAEDFEILGADNGQAGIKLAIEQIPDLILCDVMMPELDGYGVLQQLRQNPHTATIPLIFLTALADKGDARKGMELGADDYLTKPCTPDELLKAIAIRLEKKAAIDQQQTQKLDELRNTMAMSLPHELRTPLNGILGFSELLIEHADEMEASEIREMAENLKQSGLRLFATIKKYLMYAELELIARDSERIKALQNCQTHSAKDTIVEAAIAQAKQANREEDLHLDIQEGCVSIAATRLKKLLEELIENAFKFSTVGTPVIVTSQIEKHTYILSVSDKGRGMTAQQIAAVGAYMQFERKLYEQQGSGLGLAIAKRIAELHGGQLTIESLPNQQTTVRVTLKSDIEN